MNVVSIAVQEGDQLLCFLRDEELVYVEYRGGVFLDEDGSDPLPTTPPVAQAQNARKWLLLGVAVLGIVVLTWLAVHSK
jgi:hypothetical protein